MIQHQKSSYLTFFNTGHQILLYRAFYITNYTHFIRSQFVNVENSYTRCGATTSKIVILTLFTS